MALLPILEFPDPRLRTMAEPVAQIDNRIQKLIDNMFDTMYEAPGIGLAATQVNAHVQVIVIDISEEKDDPLVFINPKIDVLDSELESYDEGCLSVPGYYEEVNRPRRVKVTALNRDGKEFVIEPEGLLAVCIQHEIDHLNGKLFVDYISRIKRDRIRKKLQKSQKG